MTTALQSPRSSAAKLSARIHSIRLSDVIVPDSKMIQPRFPDDVYSDETASLILATRLPVFVGDENGSYVPVANIETVLWVIHQARLRDLPKPRIAGLVYEHGSAGAIAGEALEQTLCPFAFGAFKYRDERKARAHIKATLPQLAPQPASKPIALSPISGKNRK